MVNEVERRLLALIARLTYDSRLKEWMRRFHGIATYYLANYLGWRRLIDRAYGSLSPRSVLLAALGMNEVHTINGDIAKNKQNAYLLIKLIVSVCIIRYD